MKNLNLFVASSLMFTLILSSCTSEQEQKVQTQKPEVEVEKIYNASVFFQNLKDGDTLSSPFTVDMGVEGMEVEAAGAFKEGFGHHHIIVNCTHITEDSIVPADEKHIHFGKGQKNTDLELAAGNYCLTLQFADGFHKSYGEELSKTINIVVE
ncbi:MAG: DUF4399 domain-containing protein [Flavobacteriales bacterium]